MRFSSLFPSSPFLSSLFFPPFFLSSLSFVFWSVPLLPPFQAIPSPVPKVKSIIMDRRRKPAIREPRPEITLEEMRAILENITEIESATGIRYVKLHVTAKMIIGIRESSGKEFTINLNDLYRAYQECLRFTSPEVKKYIFMGHSPAVALLRMLQKHETY